MPETSVARGRAGGGLAPQEGFSLEIFKNADLSTGADLYNLFLFVIFPVYRPRLGLGMPRIQSLRVNRFTVKSPLKVNRFTVNPLLKVNRFTVVSTAIGENDLTLFSPIDRVKKTNKTFTLSRYE
jgi:hypothetical protein